MSEKDLSIRNAIYTKDYKIQIEFGDGKIQIVDFAAFLNSSNHPEVKKYLDLALFKQFQIVEGNLNWNDFDLIFPIWDLYRDKI